MTGPLTKDSTQYRNVMSALRSLTARSEASYDRLRPGLEDIRTHQVHSLVRLAVEQRLAQRSPPSDFEDGELGPIRSVAPPRSVAREFLSEQARLARVMGLDRSVTFPKGDQHPTSRESENLIFITFLHRLLLGERRRRGDRSPFIGELFDHATSLGVDYERSLGYVLGAFARQALLGDDPVFVEPWIAKVFDAMSDIIRESGQVADLDMKWCWQLAIEGVRRLRELEGGAATRNSTGA